jgi:hypothetical protein
MVKPKEIVKLSVGAALLGGGLISNVNQMDIDPNMKSAIGDVASLGLVKKTAKTFKL